MFPIPKASGCAVWTALGNSDGPSKADKELLYIVVEMNDGLMTGWLNKALLPVEDYPSYTSTISPITIEGLLDIPVTLPVTLG